MVEAAGLLLPVNPHPRREKGRCPAELEISKELGPLANLLRIAVAVAEAAAGAESPRTFHTNQLQLAAES
jgi:hypothetical protein